MSFSDALEYQIARRRVRDFTDTVLDEHHQAMDSFNCEDFLEKGIRAEESLARLEETLREAIYLKIIEDPSEGPGAKQALNAFYLAWLHRSEEADAWVARVQANGYRLTNLDTFLRCRESVEARLDQADWLSRSEKSRRERFSEEPW
jgi:hypothetical protein